MKRRGIAVLLGMIVAASGHDGAPPASAQPAGMSIDVKLGSCSAKLVSRTPWTRNSDGTYSNPVRTLSLVPRGTNLHLPILAAGPVRVNPNRLSFPMDAGLLPLPKNGIFGELLAGASFPGPVSAGIDTGANIKRKAPNLFLHPNKSYLYFTATHPFVVNLDKKNKNKHQRKPPARNKPKAKRKRKIVTTGFAIDPCDPAVFFGGVAVNVSGITITLDGVGFSLKGKVRHVSDMKVWTGATRRNGQADLRPYTLDGHMYVKGGVGVGLGKSLSVTGNVAATVNLDPRRNGVLGLQEAAAIFKGRVPSVIPDLKFLIEGSPIVSLMGMSIPFSKMALALDTSNPRNTRLQMAGERGPAASLAQFFPGTPPPGADLIKAGGRIQVFGNASFNVTNPRLNGSYAIKLRGVLELGPMKIEGDVDVSYRVGGVPQICAKLPGMGRMCGKDLENAAGATGEAVVTAALDTGKFFQTVPGQLDKSLNEAIQALGKLARDAEHNFHGANKCNAEARNFGRNAGTKFRAKALNRAHVFFAHLRGKLNHMSPQQRARAIRGSYTKLYNQIAAHQKQVNKRGRQKVKNWSVNPHYGKQYKKSFRASFDAAVGDLRGAMAQKFRHEVGANW